MPRPSPKHSQAPLLVAVGKVLRARRKELGVSQEQLALLAGVDRAYVGGVEREEHNPTIMTLGQLCEALQVKPSLLFKATGSALPELNKGKNE
jgi:transcriptional regulator with XRE-family HTH domain